MRLVGCLNSQSDQISRFIKNCLKMNKPSIESNPMSIESNPKSIENIIDELNKRLPRQDNLVYVMSIQSDKDRSKNRSDIMDRLDQEKRYSMSNKSSTGMVLEGSFGNSLNAGIPIQISKKNSWGQPEEHSCDCYRNCLGKDCNCFLFMEPCIPTKCCNECVQIKQQYINEYLQQKKAETLYSIYPTTNSSPNTSIVPPPAHFSMPPPPPPNIPMEQPAQQQPVQQTLPQTLPKIEAPSEETEQQSPVCACKKTRCLKMYCDCFTRKGFCSPKCSCEDCLNKQDSEARRKAVMETIRELDRGCHCKKTKCEKKYCKCYAGGDKCTKYCTCENCSNMNEELKAIRKRQSDAKLLEMEPELRIEPCKELPKNIEFELPDFSNFHIRDN